MRVLIVFATVEGHTKEIARFVEGEVTKAGHQAIMVDVSDAGRTHSIESFDRLILAASVHERRHPKSFEAWLASQKDLLAKKPTLLISVSLKAAFEDGLEEAQDYVDEMKLRTGLQPDRELLVAGAVKNGSYSYFQSQVVKLVLLGDRGKDIGEAEQVFTNWAELTATTAAFVAI